MRRVAFTIGVAQLLCACAGGPARLQLPKPPGLVWYHDPLNRSGAIAIDWSGHLVRRLTLPMPSDGGRPRWTQSPDGQYLLLWNGTIVGKSGKTVGHAPPSGWADDSRHLCSIRNAAGGDVRAHVTQMPPNGTSTTYDQAFLFVYGVDGRGRRIAPTPGPNPHGGSWAVCDFADDRAVIVTAFVVNVFIAKVIRLSTGKDVALPSGPRETPNLYTDGRLVVSSSQDLMTNSIRRVADAAEVGRLGLGQVLALSADGRVATMAVPGAAQPGNVTMNEVVRVVDTSTNQVVWSRPGYLDAALAEPGGDTMAIFLMEPSGHFDDLWLVRRDGRATQVAPRVPNGVYLFD